MEGRAGQGDAARVTRAAIVDDVPQRIAGAPRRDKTVWLRESVHAELLRRATSCGVPLGVYVENALLTMKTPLPATAVVAQPLASVGYRLAQIAQALDRGDIDATRADLAVAEAIVADALRPLRRQHADEVRDLARRGEDWSG